MAASAAESQSFERFYRMVSDRRIEVLEKVAKEARAWIDTASPESRVGLRLALAELDALNG